MLLESKYLHKQFEVEAKEIYDENDPDKLVMRIVSHDSLRKLFLDELYQIPVSCEYIPIFVNGSHNAILCKMCDSRGRITQEIGETMPKTLTNTIARNYPVLLAYQRAFDRALIAFCGFDGKVLSDLEMSDVDMNNMETSYIPEVKESDIVQKYEDSNYTESIPESSRKPTEEKDNKTVDAESTPDEKDEYLEDTEHEIEETETVISEIDIGDEEPMFEDSGMEIEDEPEYDPAKDANENPRFDELCDVIINKGKFRGKKVGDVVIEKNKSWVEWMDSSFNAKSDSDQNCLDAIREVAKKRGLL